MQLTLKRGNGGAIIVRTLRAMTVCHPEGLTNDYLLPHQPWFGRYASAAS